MISVSCMVHFAVEVDGKRSVAGWVPISCRTRVVFPSTGRANEKHVPETIGLTRWKRNEFFAESGEVHCSGDIRPFGHACDLSDP